MGDAIEARPARVRTGGAAMFRCGPTDLADGSGVAVTLGCRDHRDYGDVVVQRPL